jgi:intracellular sulfur oxidation DsrE/DsrF family protein
MRYFLLAAICSGFLIAGAQPSAKDPRAANDSLSKAIKDSLKMADLFSRATYPLIKTSKWSVVIPVENPTEIPDPKITYKLLLEEVVPVKDSAAAKEMNRGLAEVGRIINLHIASGIPKNKLDVVVVVHGPALYALYTDEQYKKMFGMANPNIVLIKELMQNGVKFIACGQAMYFFDVKKEDMVPHINVSLTAQTVLSNYQLKGYVLNKITEN